MIYNQAYSDTDTRVRYWYILPRDDKYVDWWSIH